MSLLASVMWGSSDFMGGLFSRRLPALAVYGFSQAIALAVLIVIATASGGWGADRAVWPWAIASGALGIVGMLTFYRALALGPMGIISPLVALSVIVPVAVGLLRGQLPAGLQILGIIVAIIGILLASGPELGGAESARPLLLAVVAAIGFGGMYVTLAEGAQYSSLMTTVGMRITTVTAVLIAAAVARSAGGVARRDLPGLAVLGLLDAAANIAYGWATTQEMLTTVAVLGSLYPVVTALLAAVFLHERLRPVQYAGVAATVAAIVMISAG